MYPIKNSFSLDSIFNLEEATKAFTYFLLFAALTRVWNNKMLIAKTTKYYTLIFVFKSKYWTAMTMGKPFVNICQYYKIPTPIFCVLVMFGTSTLTTQMQSTIKLINLQLRYSKKYRDMSDTEYEHTISQLKNKFKEKMQS